MIQPIVLVRAAGNIPRWAHCAGDVRPGIASSGSWGTMLLAAKDSERNVWCAVSDGQRTVRCCGDR